MTTNKVPAYSEKSYAFAPYVTAQNFIGGSFRDSVTGRTLDVENPRHGRAMGLALLRNVGSNESVRSADATTFQ